MTPAELGKAGMLKVLVLKPPTCCIGGQGLIPGPWRPLFT
jgi:hypothetical protein